VPRNQMIKSDSLWDLLQLLLRVDPADRITAQGALRHSYFIGDEAKREITDECRAIAEEMRQMMLEKKSDSGENDEELKQQFVIDSSLVMPANEITALLKVNPDENEAQLLNQMRNGEIKLRRPRKKPKFKPQNRKDGQQSESESGINYSSDIEDDDDKIQDEKQRKEELERLKRNEDEKKRKEEQERLKRNEEERRRIQEQQKRIEDEKKKKEELERLKIIEDEKKRKEELERQKGKNPVKAITQDQKSHQQQSQPELRRIQQEQERLRLVEEENKRKEDINRVVRVSQLPQRDKILLLERIAYQYQMAICPFCKFIAPASDVQDHVDDKHHIMSILYGGVRDIAKAILVGPQTVQPTVQPRQPQQQNQTHGTVYCPFCYSEVAPAQITMHVQTQHADNADQFIIILHQNKLSQTIIWKQEEEQRGRLESQQNLQAANVALTNSSQLKTNTLARITFTQPNNQGIRLNDWRSTLALYDREIGAGIWRFNVRCVRATYSVGVGIVSTDRSRIPHPFDRHFKARNVSVFFDWSFLYIKGQRQQYEDEQIWRQGAVTSVIVDLTKNPPILTFSVNGGPPRICVVGIPHPFRFALTLHQPGDELSVESLVQAEGIDLNGFPEAKRTTP
ncbi:MAG: hypothetical protein EZS28_007846, partial [Streblomastix strix]